MMARAWALLVQNEKSAAYYTKMCWIIFRHLECWDGWDPQNLLDAAGGSIDHVAKLLVGHINRVLQIKIQDDTMPVHIMALLDRTFESIVKEERASIHETPDAIVVLGPLTMALLAQGFVPALVAVLSTFNASPFVSTCQQPPYPIRSSFEVLKRILISTNGRRSLGAALRHGLLVALVSWAQLEMAEALNSDLGAIVNEILPSSLIYYDILSELAAALRSTEIIGLEQNKRFKESKMFKDWERLKDLVKKRLAVSDSRTPVYRACDNLEVSERYTEC